MKEHVREFLRKHSIKQVIKNTGATVELQILYRESLRKNIDCLTCESKIMAAYNELKQYSLHNIIHTMSENFELKEGKQIFLHSQHRMIHKGNLASDEQAIEILAKNKKLIKAFEKYPANWEEKVDAFMSKKEKVDAFMSKKEKPATVAPAPIPAPPSESGEASPPVLPMAPGNNHKPEAKSLKPEAPKKANSKK